MEHLESTLNAIHMREKRYQFNCHAINSQKMSTIKHQIMDSAANNIVALPQELLHYNGHNAFSRQFHIGENKNINRLEENKEQIELYINTISGKKGIKKYVNPYIRNHLREYNIGTPTASSPQRYQKQQYSFSDRKNFLRDITSPTRMENTRAKSRIVESRTLNKSTHMYSRGKI